MAIVDLVVSNSEKTSLQRISEITIQHPYSDIPYNIIKSSLAIFLNEMLYRSIKEQHADEGLYDFIKNSLLILDLKTESCANFHLLFLIQLSRFLGFYPQGNYSVRTPSFDLQEGRFIDQIPVHRNYLDPQYSAVLDELIHTDYENAHALRIDKQQRNFLLNSLIVFYQCHISSFGDIRSLEILQEVIS